MINMYLKPLKNKSHLCALRCRTVYYVLCIFFFKTDYLPDLHEYYRNIGRYMYSHDQNAIKAPPTTNK